jgi:hypothetical protein
MPRLHKRKAMKAAAAHAPDRKAKGMASYSEPPNCGPTIAPKRQRKDKRIPLIGKCFMSPPSPIEERRANHEMRREQYVPRCPQQRKLV